MMVDESGDAIEVKISELLARCRPGATICPSQVARALRSGEAESRAAVLTGFFRRQKRQSLDRLAYIY